MRRKAMTELNTGPQKEGKENVFGQHMKLKYTLQFPIPFQGVLTILTLFVDSQGSLSVRPRQFSDLLILAQLEEILTIFRTIFPSIIGGRTSLRKLFRNDTR